MRPAWAEKKDKSLFQQIQRGFYRIPKISRHAMGCDGQVDLRTSRNRERPTDSHSQLLRSFGIAVSSGFASKTRRRRAISPAGRSAFRIREAVSATCDDASEAPSGPAPTRSVVDTVDSSGFQSEFPFHPVEPFLVTEQ